MGLPTILLAHYLNPLIAIPLPLTRSILSARIGTHLSGRQAFVEDAFNSTESQEKARGATERFDREIYPYHLQTAALKRQPYITSQPSIHPWVYLP